MREAIGATWIMGIVIVFVALFSGYLAFSINYSKAFRVKNGIVERIEKHNGFYSEPVTGTVEDIDEFIREISYGAHGDCYKTVSQKAAESGLNSVKYVGCTGTTCIAHVEEGILNDYCIQKVTSRTQSDQLTTAYYKVYVFFSIDMPLIQNLNYLFVTTGETKSLSYPKDMLFD